jgi:hypothetical protein
LILNNSCRDERIIVERQRKRERKERRKREEGAKRCEFGDIDLGQSGGVMLRFSKGGPLLLFPLPENNQEGHTKHLTTLPDLRPSNTKKACARPSISVACVHEVKEASSERMKGDVRRATFCVRSGAFTAESARERRLPARPRRSFTIPLSHTKTLRAHARRPTK